jgi:catechol 2,3-dioxygenase-like lactoylglutathione lyase family enzyme
MKRIHIHIGVENLEEGVRFYSALLGAQPVKTKSDYAKWLLDDPRVNFAISTRASRGIDHLGIQVEEDEELAEIRGLMKGVGLEVFNEGETICCYSRSEKSWVQDPAGVPWEAYRIMADAEIFSSKSLAGNACCADRSTDKDACCDTSEKTAGCCG